MAFSVFFMGLTVFVLSFLKQMWKIRNFIHINFCVSLSTWELLSVTEAGWTEIPGLCQAITLVHHYFLLVLFMWMLMESVVLYVVLVRAFVKKLRCYIVVLSYGLPALYMCLIVPLGLAFRDDERLMKYVACWPTHFNIWTFAIPVFLIILISMLINIGFFIMTIWIMYKHARKGTKMSHWLKRSVSLLVMGITWIIGVMLFHYNILLSVTYIFCKKIESELLSSIFSSHESRTFTRSSTIITSRGGEEHTHTHTIDVSDAAESGLEGASLHPPLTDDIELIQVVSSS